MGQLNKHSLLNKIINKTSHFWEIIVDYFRLIKIVRFSVFIALAVIVFMLVPQGKEALIAMMENANQSDYAQRNYFLLFNFILALMCWFYARTLYRFAFKEKVKHSGYHEFFKKHFPRWLGFSMIFFPALIVNQITKQANSLFFYMLVSSFVFLLFVYLRRRMFGLTSFYSLDESYLDVRKLPRHTKLILSAFILLNWFLLFIFTFFGQIVSVKIGATAVVMLALATLLSVGSTITYLGERKGIPLLFVIIMVAVLTSAVTDNHDIRLIDANTKYLNNKTSIKQHFKQWLSKRSLGSNKEKPIPVFFVSTEGGGIRAAYWTAIVLGSLQDSNPRFAQHIYAISGVSGGSLGASVFNGLLTKDSKMDKNNSYECVGNNNYFCRAKRILGEDFLAPTVASLMFPDAFQRFCFFCSFNDRAQALEESWEIAWDNEWQGQPSAQGVFNKDFHNIWADDAEMKIPQLLLNSTIVETGQRIIATSLNLDKSFSDTFHDALATFSVTNKSMRLSTAVLTSARFTYVSPAGTLLRKDSSHNNKWIRLVDGGYFENSGAIAIAEVVKDIRSLDSSLNFIPIVIHISNEPGYPKRIINGTESKASFLGEILTPLKAIFAVRVGKGQEARIALKHIITNMSEMDNFLHFNLKKPTNNVQLPLGWMLSTSAQSNMDLQLMRHNSFFDKIDSLLKY